MWILHRIGFFYLDTRQGKWYTMYNKGSIYMKMIKIKRKYWYIVYVVLMTWNRIKWEFIKDDFMNDVNKDEYAEFINKLKG